MALKSLGREMKMRLLHVLFKGAHEIVISLCTFVRAREKRSRRPVSSSPSAAFNFFKSSPKLLRGGFRRSNESPVFQFCPFVAAAGPKKIVNIYSINSRPLLSARSSSLTVIGFIILKIHTSTSTSTSAWPILGGFG